MEKSYFEVKVTFIHVVIMLVAIILIGIFLFYLGYQAGHRSLQSGAGQPAGAPATIETVEAKADQEKVEPVEEKKPITRPTAKQPQTIENEIKLHQDQAQEKPPVKEVTATRGVYYTIQVGAFIDFANAKAYSEKFRRLGYGVEIISPEGKDKEKWFRVRVGKFATMEKAKAEKEKLEKLEKKTFSISSSK